MSHIQNIKKIKEEESLKPQASSAKRKKLQAASLKPNRAASFKRQAPSVKFHDL